ncbi:MAG TPA: M56 family metallopeptidase [Puia sp.]|nr:M56 family metallopeptidase [Puia sp.]
MERLITYVLESVLVSGMLMAYYWVALRNRKLHGYNRFYLLGALLLSLVLPLVRIGWTPVAGAPVLGGTVERVENITRSADNGFHWVTVECWAGLVVSGMLLLVSLRRVAQVFRLKTRQQVSRMWGYDLIETDDPRAPFSFFNNLFWRRGVDPADPVNKKILFHELAHIGGRHSWDSLFAQALTSVFWMNPFFWLIRRELSVVHEFIADEATGMEGDAEGFARMLLQSVNEGQWLEPVQGFFQSPIKRRLEMISQFRRSRFRLLRMVLVVPVILAATLFVACTKGQAQPDRLDQAKLITEKKMQKFLELIKSGALKKQKIVLSFAGDSAGRSLELKQQMEVEFLTWDSSRSSTLIKKGQ